MRRRLSPAFLAVLTGSSKRPTQAALESTTGAVSRTGKRTRGPATSRRPGKPWSGRSRWIRAMNWRKRICVIAGGRPRGGNLTKRGTLRRLAVLRAHSAEKRTPSLPFTTNTVGRRPRHQSRHQCGHTSVVAWLLARLKRPPPKRLSTPIRSNERVTMACLLQSKIPQW